MLACTKCNHIEPRPDVIFCPNCGKPMTDLLPYVKFLLKYGEDIVLFSIALFVFNGILLGILLRIIT